MFSETSYNDSRRKHFLMDEEIERNEQHFKNMTETPVRRLVLRLAVPTVISMLISSIYSIADTLFVSQLGTSAMGAVGICFSVMAIIQAIGFSIGMGAGTVASHLLGGKRKDDADTYASTGFFFGLVLSILLGVIGLAFLTPILKLLGATETILPYAKPYASIILLSSPLMCQSFILTNYFRSVGKAKYGLLGLATGMILNIALDPVFILVLDLGTFGAGIATLIGQVVAFSILFGLFLAGRSTLELSFNKISLRPRVYLHIMYTGLPTMARQGLSSSSTVSLNVMAAMFGDPVVAAVSIAARVMFLLYSFMLGLGHGYQPVASFNYGAKKYERVIDATRFTVNFGSLLMVIFSIILLIKAPNVIRIFSSTDSMVVRTGAMAIRLQCLVFSTLGFIIVTDVGLQSTASPGKATILAICRQGVFFIPIVLILPRILGIWGLVLAQPLADLCTVAIAAYYYNGFLKEMKGHLIAEKANIKHDGIV